MAGQAVVALQALTPPRGEMSNRIGRYEIQAELGHGGFGQVFRAYDPTVGRLVAIKTLTASSDPDLLRRFRNEAAAAGRLRHNNIVIIYDFGEHEDAPYLVMELLDGEDLDRLIDSGRPLSLLQKLDIIAQSASGLHHAHSKGIVHRDVKPANIMLQRDSVVKIVDFGIALLTQLTSARITSKGSLIGTFPYMAPEQFAGHSSDALTDIFSFGVTCYKLLCGTHPFQAEEISGVMYNIVNKTPALLRTLSPECPEALEQAVFRMLAKDRDARYHNLEDVRFDLEPVMLELRKERVNDLLTEARGLMESNQFDSAQAIVRQALDTDPANRTARELREALQRKIWEDELRPRVAALVHAGREQLESRCFQVAIQRFESALQLDRSNTEIPPLISQARAAWDRADLAVRLLDDARQSLNRGDLTAAHGIILKALSTDPSSSDAETLRANVQERLDAREWERRLDEGLNQAKRLILLESFDQAIAFLADFSRLYPESTAIRELQGRARTGREKQQRRERLQSSIEDARSLLRANRFTEALEHLNTRREEFPESDELRDLAALAGEEAHAQKQSEAIAAAIAEGRALLDACQFDTALEFLRNALAEYPGANAIRELLQAVASEKSEHQRKAALEEAGSQAKALIEGGRFAEAADRIGAFARAYGAATEIEPLRLEAEEGIEAQRRQLAVNQLMAKARSLVDEGRPDSATRLLQEATLQFPDHPELIRLLGEARHRFDEQRQAEEISRIINEAESLNRASQFERALETLDKGLAEYAGADRLLRCRQATLASQARHRREEIRRKAFDDARALRQAGKLTEALAAIETALGEVGDETGLIELRRQIEREQDAHERVVEVRNIFDRAQSMIEDGEFISATELLQASAVRFPGAQSLESLHEVAQARLREQQRKDQVKAAATEAREHGDGKRFEAALSVLEAAVRQFGSEPELDAARRYVLQQQDEHRRLKELEELTHAVRGLVDAGRLQDAERALKAGLDKFGERSELTQLQGSIESARQAQRQREAAREHQERERRERSAAIQATIAEAKTMLAGGRVQPAIEAIRALLEKYPDELEVRQLLAVAEAELRRQEREGEVESVRQQAKRLVNQLKYSEAIALVNSRFPGEPGLVEILSIAQKQLAAQKQQEARDRARTALLAIEQQIASTRHSKLRGLVATARQHAAMYASDPELGDIASRIEQQAELALSAPAPPGRRVPARWIGIGAGAAAIAAAGLIVGPRWFVAAPAKAPHESTYPVEIHTDPSGAKVRLGDRSCTSPECRFDLTPGQYPVEARLAGYRPLWRTITIDATQGHGVTNLSLEPERPPPPAAGSERATLVVRTGAGGVRVVVDRVPHGLTDQRGELHTVLEAGRHSVFVEKAGFITPAEQKVALSGGRTQGLTFEMNPRPSKLEIRGAPRGAEVRIAGQISRIEGSILSLDRVPAGEQNLEVSEGKLTRQLVRRFDPGATLTLDWRDIAPAPSVVPPQITAAAKEAQEWERVRNTPDPDALDAFLRDFPSGAHAEPARARLDEVGWARANQSDARSLQAYLARFPRGTHVRDAQTAIDDLSWNALNKGETAPLQTFIDQNAASRHRAEAQAIIDRLNKEKRGPVISPLAQAVEANKRGVALYNLNLLQEAIVNFDESIRIAPKFASAYFNRGGAYYRLGRFDRAAEDFERALSLDPSSSSAKDMLNDARRRLVSGIQVVGGDVSAPLLRKTVEPQYTREARAAKLEGRVVLQCVISPKGEAQEIKVLRKLGMGLDGKAIEAVKKMKFEPAMKAGTAVPVFITVEVKFQLPK